MEQFQMTQSIVKEQQKNEFLDQNFKYQMCPHCQRNFFQGKLKYHLKLCKANNPMTKSPLRKTKRSYLSTALEKTQNLQAEQIGQSPRSFTSPQIKFKKCQFCKATFPLSMINKHQQKCNFKPHAVEKQQDTNPQIQINKLKSKTKVDFDFKSYTKQLNKDQLKQPASALPRIRHTRQRKQIQKKYISQDLKQLSKNYTVRIRQQLSCFKKALQVQQIQCPYCNRKFSKQASLRHIPICQKLKNQQIHQIILKKNQLNTKSQIYKLNIPIKKTTLFRNKFKSQLIIQKSQQLQSKSARIFDIQKIKNQRQQGNKTTVLSNNKRKSYNMNKNQSTKLNGNHQNKNNNEKYQKIVKNNKNIIFDKQYEKSSPKTNRKHDNQNLLKNQTIQQQSRQSAPIKQDVHTHNIQNEQQSSENHDNQKFLIKQQVQKTNKSKTIPINQIMNMTFSKDLNIASPVNKQTQSLVVNKQSQYFKRQIQQLQENQQRISVKEKEVFSNSNANQELHLLTIIPITNEQEHQQLGSKNQLKNKNSLHNLYNELNQQQNSAQINEFLSIKISSKKDQNSNLLRNKNNQQQENKSNQEYNQDFQ